MFGTTRTSRYLIGTAVALTVLAGCSPSDTTTPAPPTEGLPAPATSAAAQPPPSPPASANTAFLLETPEFSVGLPSEPIQQNQELPGVPGAGILTYIVEAPRYAIVVGVIDYPADVPLDADPTVLLEGARDGAVANVPGATLTSSTPTTVDGRPALDIVADADQNAVYLARIVLDDRRLYQLATVGDVDRTAEHAEFVGSLNLAG